MMRKRLFPWALAAVMTLCGTLMFTSCSDNDDTPLTPPAGERTIVVLFENDVHCAIGGYASLAGLRDAVSDTAYAALVSSGDYLQGGTIGAISKGQYIIDVMRSMHYDAVTVGNHEFDYQTSRLQELMAGFNAPVVCCNLYDMNNNRLFSPYTISTYGSKRIAYVGVLTPETQLQSEIYAFYDEKGKQLYDTRCDSYTQLVQQAADDARKEGPGETGGFVQATGLKYTARASDKKITDVQVLQPDGTYAPLDPQGHYSVAVLDFCVTGGGFGGVFRGNTLLETGSKLSRDLVVDYVIVALHGNVGTDYASPQDRITIVE